jgi:hypothetical protein
MKIDEVSDWGLMRVDVFTMAFVAKPVFLAMWDQTGVVIKEMVEQSKDGAFWIWVNYVDSPVNRLFDRWMREKQIPLIHEYIGPVRALVENSPLHLAHI